MAGGRGRGGSAAAAVLPFDCLGDERRLRQHCQCCLCAWCLVQELLGLREGGREAACVCVCIWRGGGGGVMLRWINTVDTKGLANRDLLFSSLRFSPPPTLPLLMAVCDFAVKGVVERCRWVWAGGCCKAEASPPKKKKKIVCHKHAPLRSEETEEDNGVV